MSQKTQRDASSEANSVGQGVNSELFATHFRSGIETVAFWTAILLPVTYLPALYAGFGPLETVGLLGTLVVFHLCALSVGHGHGR